MTASAAGVLVVPRLLFLLASCFSLSPPAAGFAPFPVPMLLLLLLDENISARWDFVVKLRAPENRPTSNVTATSGSAAEVSVVSWCWPRESVWEKCVRVLSRDLLIYLFLNFKHTRIQILVQTPAYSCSTWFHPRSKKESLPTLIHISVQWHGKK